MTLFKQQGKKPTQPIGEATLNNLPTLTEVVSETGNTLSQVLGEDEAQQLLHKLEAHLATLFTQKLAIQLEQLQRQAIDHALDELKAELPELLREALNEHLEAR